jgi:serine/threonine-protein kinase
MNRSSEEDMLAARGRPVAVGKYRVLAELGRGGMANVFLAVIRGPAGIGKLVVLKALLPELACQPEALEMFLDEARLATQLNHVNVVQTYEVGTEGERHVIVMEYLDGQPLSAVLHRARASGQELAREHYLSILLSVLDGLHYAHELCSYDGTLLSLVHRDVSPHNVFICYDGQVKVLDFGIAKATSSGANTATGLLKGKIAYMPPEQMAGSSLDRRADIFAVGCMLWDMAAGRKLWKDMPNASIYRKVMNGEIPRPSTVNPACDEELERITMKALAPEPDDRYPSALALHQDLERYAERYPKPKGKDVGAFVAKLFSERRQELKAVLEKQLAALRVEDENSRSSSSNNDLERHRTHLASSVDVANTETRARSLRAKLRPRLGYWVGAAVISTVLIAGVGVRALPSEDEARDEPAGKGTPEAPAASERSAVITFAAAPAEARLVLDGELLDGTSVVRRLARDGQVHRLHVTADGYSPVTREFTVDNDAPIEVVLRKMEPAVPPPAPKPPATTGKRRDVAPAPRPAAGVKVPAEKAAAPDCSQPFVLDITGARRIRPECR